MCQYPRRSSSVAWQNQGIKQSRNRKQYASRWQVDEDARKLSMICNIKEIGFETSISSLNWLSIWHEKKHSQIVRMDLQGWQFVVFRECKIIYFHATSQSTDQNAVDINKGYDISFSSCSEYELKGSKSQCFSDMGLTEIIKCNNFQQQSY